MKGTTFFKIQIGLHLIGLSCVLLVPAVRESRLVAFLVTVFGLWIAFNAFFLQHRTSTWLSFLTKWWPPRLLLRLFLTIPIVAFGFTVCDDAYSRRLPMFQGAIHALRESKTSKFNLGEPIEVGWPVSGSYEEGNKSEYRTLEIPVRGSYGEGSLFGAWTKTNEVWKMDELKLILSDGSSRPIRDSSTPESRGEVCADTSSNITISAI